MNDQRKTKKELIDELNAARKEIKKSQKQISGFQRTVSEKEKDCLLELKQKESRIQALQKTIASIEAKNDLAVREMQEAKSGAGEVEKLRSKLAVLQERYFRNRRMLRDAIGRLHTFREAAPEADAELPKRKIKSKEKMSMDRLIGYIETLRKALNGGSTKLSQNGNVIVLSPSDDIKMLVKAIAKGDEQKLSIAFSWEQIDLSIEAFIPEPNDGSMK